MRIKLSCLACGHAIELGDAYEDYEGEVRCWSCRAVLQVTLQEGKLRSMKRSNGTPAPRKVNSAAPEVRLPAVEPAPSAADQETR